MFFLVCVIVSMSSVGAEEKEYVVVLFEREFVLPETYGVPVDTLGNMWVCDLDVIKQKYYQREFDFPLYKLFYSDPEWRGCGWPTIANDTLQDKMYEMMKGFKDIIRKNKRVLQKITTEWCDNAGIGPMYTTVSACVVKCDMQLMEVKFLLETEPVMNMVLCDGEVSVIEGFWSERFSDVLRYAYYGQLQFEQHMDYCTRDQPMDVQFKNAQPVMQ